MWKKKKSLPLQEMVEMRVQFLGQEDSPGGGHGNPLQYSCLENPKDRGAWQATVHRVSQSQTWLKWLSISKQDHSHIYQFSVSLRRWRGDFPPWHVYQKDLLLLHILHCVLVMKLKEMWSPFHSYIFTLLGDSIGCLLTLFKLYFNASVLPMQLIMILEMKML